MLLADNALTTLDRAKQFLDMVDEVPPDGGAVEPEPTPEQGNESTMAELFPEGIEEEVQLSKQDKNIIFLINAASSVIESFCRRIFALKEYNEVLIGRDSVKLVLPQYPIVELTSLEISRNGMTENIDVSTIRVMSEIGMLYRPNGGFPSNVITGTFMHPNFDNPLHNIFVQFKAGYVLPKDDTPETPRTLPYDVELACFKIIANLKRDQEISQGNGAQNVKSESLGDWSISYDSEIKMDYANYASTLSPDVQNLLLKYRQNEFEL